MAQEVKALQPFEVAAFRNYCEHKGYVVTSAGPKEFVFIAGKHGTQRVPIVQGNRKERRQCLQ